MKRLILDLDNTISFTKDGDYANALPNEQLIKRIREYKQSGFEIVIATSRNMRTYNGSIGKINANTLPVIIDWLSRHSVPYDELIMGKAWCGFDGFYVDDKAVRPDEFISMSYEELKVLLEKK